MVPASSALRAQAAAEARCLLRGSLTEDLERAMSTGTDALSVEEEESMALRATVAEVTRRRRPGRSRLARTCRDLAIVGGAVMLSATGASAGVPADQLKGSVDQVVEVLKDPKLKAESMSNERRVAVRKIANNIFDFTETAKRALGPHWQNLSDKDREEFVSLFSDLLEGAYISKIEQYSGEPIKFVGDSVDGDLATVRTRIITKKGTEIPIDYRMLRRGERWLVYDVNIEGVSLVGNYRTQFNKIIQTASYGELIKRMKAHDSDLNRSARTPRS
jgi:phospholipid transport system substrate-binding protein